MQVYNWNSKVLACMLLYLFSYAVMHYVSPQTYNLYYAADMIPAALSLAMLVFSYRRHLGSIKVFWLLIALGSGCYIGASSSLIFSSWELHMEGLNLSPAQIFWHLQAFLYLIAMFYIMFKEKNVSQGIRFLYDSFIIMLVSGTVFWEFIIRPNMKFMLESSSWASIVNALLYPVVDFGIIMCLFMVYFAYQPLFPYKSLLLFTSGIVLFVIADLMYFSDVSLGTYEKGVWYDPLWSIALVAVGYSGVYSLHKTINPESAYFSIKGKIRKLRLIIPYMCLLLLFPLMADRIRSIDGVVVGTFLALVLIVIRQITVLMENDVLVLKLKQMLRSSEFLAEHDELSKLPNKRLFERKVNEAIKEAEASGERLAVFFMDLDRFKYINDSLGHAAGDQLIQQVSKRIVQAVSEKHLVARMGGDEFTLLIRGFDTKQELTKLASFIIQDIARPFRIGDHAVRTSTSIGIAVYPEDSMDKSELMKHADMAMYRAKELGGSRSQFFTRAMMNQMQSMMTMERDLRQALDNRELVLYYQPQVCSHTGRIVGVEALLRWNRNGAGLVSPSEFIQLAEETGLIVPMGEWVLRTACLEAAQWRRQETSPLKLAVNVSPKQLIQADFVEHVAGILAESGIDSGRLVIEITEGVALLDTEETANALLGLKALGLQVTMDDFGTGYCSLGYLHTFQLDGIKIAQSFVGQMTENDQDASIVRAIMAMAQSLNLTVVAEGVETREQFILLKEINADCVVQGYYFHKPMPLEELIQLLEAVDATTGEF